MSTRGRDVQLFHKGINQQNDAFFFSFLNTYVYKNISPAFM